MKQSLAFGMSFHQLASVKEAKDPDIPPKFRRGKIEIEKRDFFRQVETKYISFVEAF